VTAHAITVVRVALAFAVVVLLHLGGLHIRAAMLPAVFVVIMMDWLDGWIARRLGETTRFGALLDIAGDRIVEDIFWIYFAVVGLVAFWIPMVVVARGLLTDMVRTMAFARGKTAFGKETMMRGGLPRLLVASKASRGLYAALKMASFLCLTTLLALQSAPAAAGLPSASGPARTVALVVVYATVAMCLLRGIPVIWNGRRYLLENAR
jgi:CDP-diacylglycerol--glycerol-3-phosphate 3-phosphatidyltransferase